MIIFTNGKKIIDEIIANIISKLEPKQKFKFNGKFKFECFDSLGNLKWIDESKNITVDEGLNDNLGVYFKDGTKNATWYLGLIGTNSTPLAGWDAAGIGTDFTEYQNYSEAVRQTWVSGAVAAKSLSNSASPAEFNINGAGGTVYGAFMISNSTKGGTTGVMWCASLLGTARTVVSGDIIRVQYTISNQDV